MKDHQGLLGFVQQYGTEQGCKEHLYKLKWETGYSCRRCGHSKSIKGATRFHQRCQRCKYDESSTAHTLFHKIKFPLPKAFTIIYQLSTMKKGMSSCEIARQFNIHQETARCFRLKVMRAMSWHNPPLLEGSVEVDETTIGGYEIGRPGRSHGSKKKVQVAVEIDYPQDEGEPRIRAADARLIDGYSTHQLGQAIDSMVSSDALVTTDGLPAYDKAVNGRDHMVWLSDQGQNFEKLHWHIFNIKNWIRGIHHRISKKHTQYYLNEFHFRFNNRNWIQQCPQKVLRIMAILPWMPYNQIIAT